MEVTFEVEGGTVCLMLSNGMVVGPFDTSEAAKLWWYNLSLDLTVNCVPLVSPADVAAAVIAAKEKQ